MPSGRREHIVTLVITKATAQHSPSGRRKKTLRTLTLTIRAATTLTLATRATDKHSDTILRVAITKLAIQHSPSGRW